MSENKTKDSVIFYRSFYEASQALNDEQRLALYEAIFEYGLNQEETKMEPLVNAMFSLIKPQLQANNKKYENGKKGGRPKKDTEENKPKENQSETEQEPNVNENENVNENKKEELKIIDSQFDEFWEIYGNKVDRKIARDKFGQAIKKTSIGSILLSAGRYKKYCEVTDTPMKHPKTWLSQECWENDYEQLTEEFNGKANRSSSKSGGQQGFSGGKPSTSEQLANSIAEVGAKYSNINGG